MVVILCSIIVVLLLIIISLLEYKKLLKSTFANIESKFDNQLLEMHGWHIDFKNQTVHNKHMFAHIRITPQIIKHIARLPHYEIVPFMLYHKGWRVHIINTQECASQLDELDSRSQYLRKLIVYNDVPNMFKSYPYWADGVREHEYLTTAQLQLLAESQPVPDYDLPPEAPEPHTFNLLEDSNSVYNHDKYFRPPDHSKQTLDFVKSYRPVSMDHNSKKVNILNLTT